MIEVRLIIYCIFSIVSKFFIYNLLPLISLNVKDDFYNLDFLHYSNYPA